MFAATVADAATISGTVKGPDGAALRGAFVQARNAKTKIMVSVLTDNQGKYIVENLPAGDYKLAIRATGFKADPKDGVKLTDEQTTSHNFALQTKPIEWSEISLYQGLQLLPDGVGKKTLAENCFGCHGFQNQMAAHRRDADEWRVRVDFMRGAMRSSLGDRRGSSLAWPPGSSALAVTPVSSRRMASTAVAASRAAFDAP